METIGRAESFAGHGAYFVRGTRHRPRGRRYFELAKAVADSISARLGSSASSVEEEPEAEESTNQAQPTAAIDNDDDDDEDDEDDDIDIGVSKLREFHQFVSSPEAIKRWIEDETANYEAERKEGKLGAEDEPPETSLRSLLLSLLKPAMIVDGQHRVTGAANASVNEDIVFTVCALKDADWVQQVFQFVVLNKLAKPISKDFLTGLLNTSLTNEEISDIEPKLERVGISNADRVIMRTVNFEPESPFHDMVAQPGEVVGAQNAGKLSGQGMLKIAKRWRNLGGSKKTLKELRMFEKLLTEKSNSARAREWLGGKNMDPDTGQLRRGKWAGFFHTFWKIIKAIYEPSQIWEKGPGFHLLMIVTMYELQDYFIETKAAADARFSSMEDFEDQVRTFFADVPAAFFQNWEATGLQSGDGPATIRQALKMFKEGSKLKEVTKASPLFNSSKKKTE